MSRRYNPAADKAAANKAAANQAVIKNLLKLPGNRVCADCKRNKLPRWASWNLGIFICIRCSGIHRSMGTHISKVKSVDLDSWTDEQLQSVVKWGNTRANKYWEANLAPGHVPSEAKIDNFIRTKYESKRWVREGGIPDPSTLDDSDDDNVPLKQVQEKLERKSSAAAAAAAAAATPPPQSFDIFGDDAGTTIKLAAEAPKAEPPKASKPADSSSLLGLDFFAPTPAPRPSSVTSDPGKMSSSSRPDLNRSILSLYASAPKPQVRPQSPPMAPFGSSLQSSMTQQPSTFADMNDSFGSLSFSTQVTTPVAPKPSPFANLTAGMKKSAAAPQLSKPSSGGFFTPAQPKPSPVNASSGLGDLFDFGSPAPAPSPQATTQNKFNSLSFDADAWVTPAATASTAPNSNSAWGTSALSSTNAWSTTPSATTTTSSATTSMSKLAATHTPYVNNDDGWGNFNSGSVPPAPVKVTTGNPGFDDDLFGNVWK